MTNGDSPRTLLRCLTCGKTVQPTSDDLFRFVQTQYWPRCCGEVMALSEMPQQDGSRTHASDNSNDDDGNDVE
jgi:hypothetical protein